MEAKRLNSTDYHGLKLAGSDVPGGSVAGQTYTFGDRFAWLIRVVKSGRLAELKPTALALWLVYAAHADESLEAFPGEIAIQKSIVASADTIRLARKQLAGVGLIEVLRVGRGRIPTRVRLVDPDPTPLSARGQSPYQQGGSPLMGKGGSGTNKVPRSSTSKNDDELPVGLFDRAEAVAAMMRLDFGTRDARRQVDHWGPSAIMLAIEHIRCLQTEGYRARNVRKLVISTLAKVEAGEITIDPKAVKRRAAAERAEARRLDAISRAAADDDAEDTVATDAADAQTVEPIFRGWMEHVRRTSVDGGEDQAKAIRFTVNQMQRDHGWDAQRTCRAIDDVLGAGDQGQLFGVQEAGNA